MQRASVDLPQPDSPTSPNVSPRLTSNETPSTARSSLPPLCAERLLDAVDPQCRVLGARAEAGRQRSFVRPCAHTASSVISAGRGNSPAQRCSAKWHSATTGRSPGLSTTGGGTVVRQISTPFPIGQRGSNVQPGGRCARLGGNPGIDRQRPALRAGPARGTERSSASVYGMRRTREDLVGVAALDHPTRVHDEDAVAELGHDAEVVRDQQHRRAALGHEPLEQVEDLRLRRHVERGRRLVGDQQVRLVGERDRDHHALAHAARVLVRDSRRAGCSAFGTSTSLSRLDGERGARARRLILLVAQDDLRDLVADLAHRVERGHRVLEDQRHLLAAHRLHLAVGQPGDVAAVEHHAAALDAAGRLDQPQDRERRAPTCRSPTRRRPRRPCRARSRARPSGRP